MKRKKPGTYVSLWFSPKDQMLLNTLKVYAVTLGKTRNQLIKDILAGWVRGLIKTGKDGERRNTQTEGRCTPKHLDTAEI